MSSHPSPRYSVLGVNVHATDYARATSSIIAAARDQKPFAATALAVHGVMTGVDDYNQRTRLNQLDLVTPDGQPVRWALNWLYSAKLSDRVYGPFLMLRLCGSAADANLSIFLYGSDLANLQALSSNLRKRFPNIRIAGIHPSRFRAATATEWAEDVRLLSDSNADIIFCGLGCPRQEAWVHEMRGHINRPLVAVGAAFTFWAGGQPMAPAWMQRIGLEWAFRLLREPRRLWRRYLLVSPPFIVGLLRQKLQPTAFVSCDSTLTPPVLHWS